MAKVQFKVFDAAGAFIRVITVEVEEGKKLKKRAELEALTQVKEGETVQIVADGEQVPGTPKPGGDAPASDPLPPSANATPEPPPAAKSTNAKGSFKFTFEFEFYENGVHKRTSEVSAVNDTEDGALEAVVTELKAALGPDESYRYTNTFRREPVKE